MATIGNLGAADSNRIVRKEKVKIDLPVPNRINRARNEAIAASRRASEIRRMEEAQKSRDSSVGRVRANERQTEQITRMTLEEFAEMLQKVNLTFDLFEIQARFSVNNKTGEISVQVINQRTGEVIRKIPPYDVPKLAEALQNGDAIVTDITA